MHYLQTEKCAKTRNKCSKSKIPKGILHIGPKFQVCNQV